MEFEGRPDLKIVHVVCFAGTDRSRMIAEELNRRGYVATYSGILRGRNYTTEEDLNGVQDIIFTTQRVANGFKKDRGLNKYATTNQVNKHIIGITESEKEAAIQQGDIESLNDKIRSGLDSLGFPDIRGKSLGRLRFGR